MVKKTISRKLMEERPQEVGKIKLGGRGRAYKNSGGGTSYVPEKFDHFEVVTRARDGDGAFLRDEAVHAVVGPEPRELEGWLMYPEIEQNLLTQMREYAGKRPKVICDGESYRTDKGVEGPCPRLLNGECKCRPYCRLQLQLAASPHTLGYYVFRSRGWETTNNLQTAMEEMYLRFGALFLAPVKLICYQSEDHYTDAGKDMTGRSWKVALVLNMPMEQAALHMAEKKERLAAIRGRLLLTAGQVQADLDERDEEEAEEIADEFDPPKGVEASIGTQAKLDEVAENLQPVQMELGSEEPGEKDNLTLMIEDYRDTARELDLLDVEAETAIEAALSTQDEKKKQKVLKALERRFAEYQGAKT
jgi:hypothetical protein